MDYTPYYDTMRRTSLLRGMTDAELDTLMACFAPRVRRYAKGELLLMAGYETHEVGLVLEGAITASKPLADGSTVVMARMGPGGVFAQPQPRQCLRRRGLSGTVSSLRGTAAPLRRAAQRTPEAAAELAGDHQRQIFCAGPPFGADLLQEPARTHLHVAAGTARAVRRGYVFPRHDPH
mgnify:CR=1 FL=1